MNAQFILFPGVIDHISKQHAVSIGYVDPMHTVAALKFPQTQAKAGILVATPRTGKQISHPFVQAALFEPVTAWDTQYSLYFDV